MGKSTRYRILGDYFADCQKLDPQSFAKEHGNAFFLHHGPIGKLREPLKKDPTLEAESPGTMPDKRFVPGEDFLIFPVRHGSAGKPGDSIWVGRSEDNDIVIPDAAVSALHALIKTDKQGKHYLEDTGSMNGTFVNDNLVPVQGKGEPVQLESGSRVRFGSVAMTFLSAPDFHTMITRLLDE
jgi:pSer/pThr/pTyr-binding forkhead associated (FHA) protein